VTEAIRAPGLPKRNFEYPLAGACCHGSTATWATGEPQEWKGQAETQQILDRNGRVVPVDGICVRVGAMRCHSQALTIKLRRALPLDGNRSMIAEAKRLG